MPAPDTSPYENEKISRQQYIDIHMLFDENQLIASRLNLCFSPVFFIINKNREVIHEGALDEPYKYWKALNIVNKG
ncbi:MAG: hypothetical protein JKX98_12645 [Alcanivoracaceae bacterium]|nr:hypothetical protein [Alcanivoracaceae bacterium]